MTDQQINQAIAEACGWPILDNPPKGFYPDCCTDLNAMHEAEKTLGKKLSEYGNQLCEMTIANKDDFPECYIWHATARQRAESFLLTLGKWSATNKDSLTVGATAQESSAVQSTSSGGSGGASTYGGKGLGIAGGALPPETQITVNGKTFCLADIDKEMTE